MGEQLTLVGSHQSTMLFVICMEIFLPGKSECKDFGEKVERPLEKATKVSETLFISRYFVPIKYFLLVFVWHFKNISDAFE